MQKINIALTFDDNYAKYAAVTINSIMSNAFSSNEYHIYAISDGISVANKNLLSKLIKHRKKFFIHFIDVSTYDMSNMHLNSYMSASTYFRFYIPELLYDCDKVIYLDCDLVVNFEISNLFSINLQDYLGACVPDSYVNPIINKVRKDKNPINSHLPKDFTYEYFEDILKLKTDYIYFNAGVMMMNLSLMRKTSFQERLFRKLNEVKEPILQDQDILNACFSDVYRENKKPSYIELDRKFNSYPRVISFKMILKYNILNLLIRIGIKSSFMEQRFRETAICHFIGPDKPWNNRIKGYLLFLKYMYNKNMPREFVNQIIEANSNFPQISPIRRFLLKYIL